MTSEEKERFLIEQTIILLAGRLGNSKTSLLPKGCIDEHFEITYKALATELKKSYISQYAK
ncbi:hypothetical protein ABQ428_15140 [Citrobacter freundii]|uniref:hypothetical protein n=1 Tax=Citrobacter freundii TaxID=546 RepID=UPI0037C7221E